MVPVPSVGVYRDAVLAIDGATWCAEVLGRVSKKDLKGLCGTLCVSKINQIRQRIWDTDSVLYGTSLHQHGSLVRPQTRLTNNSLKILKINPVNLLTKIRECSILYVCSHIMRACTHSSQGCSWKKLVNAGQHDSTSTKK